MRLLREYIRALLTESIDPKIMSMIDRAEEAGFKVTIDPQGEGADIRLVHPDRTTQGGWKEGIGSSAIRVIGAVTFVKTDESFDGPCLQSYQVGGSRVHLGYGPLLYDIAIELSGGLTADRTSVSDAAEAVWDYYSRNRPDVEVVQLDIPDDYFEDQLTPDDPSDDCSQVPAYDRYGSSWHKSGLSKLVKKGGTPVIDELRKRGMLEER